MAVLPQRTLGVDTDADHVADHNSLHPFFDVDQMAAAANGTVLTKTASGGQYVSAGSAATEFQSGTVVVRPSKGDITTSVARCREHDILSQSTDHDTQMQAAIDHVSNFEGGTGHEGGNVLIAAYRYGIDNPVLGRPVDVGSTIDVWPIGIIGEHGLNGAPATDTLEGSHDPSGGTAITWQGGSAPSGGGAVLNMSNDCHGYVIADMAISGKQVATYCAKSAGRGIMWRDVRFRMPLPTSAGWGLWITNGTDTSHDRYVQQRVIRPRFEGNTGGHGLRVVDGLGGSGCTDGRIIDLQVNGCNDGGALIDAGGWGVVGGHIAGNASGGGTPIGMQVAAGFFHLTTFYFDITTHGPNLDITNSGYNISGCFVNIGNKTSTAYGGIDVHGNDGVINGINWGGGSNNEIQYFLQGTSGATVYGAGIAGPGSQVISGAVNPAINRVIGDGTW